MTVGSCWVLGVVRVVSFRGVEGVVVITVSSSSDKSGETALCVAEIVLIISSRDVDETVDVESSVRIGVSGPGDVLRARPFATSARLSVHLRILSLA